MNISHFLYLTIFAGFAYVIILVGMYFGQRHLLYHPDPSVVLPEEVNATSTDRVYWKTHDGIDNPVWVRKPLPKDGADKPLFILYFHGNAGEVSWRYKRLRPVMEAGIGAIFPSYRYNADPAAKPSEAALKKDAEAHYDRAKKDLGLQDDQIILYGESLGSGLALHLASQGKGRAVILDGAYPSILEIAQQKYSWLPVSRLLKDRFDSLSLMDRMNLPILQMHGTNDRLIPMEFAKKLHDARPDIVQWHPLDGAGHSDLYDFGAARTVSNFLKSLK